MNKVLSNLNGALGNFKFDDPIEGPRGDTFHHIYDVTIAQGNDDYEFTEIVNIKTSNIEKDQRKIETKSRPRDMGGVVITFWSENHYLWTRTFLFHKGSFYTHDTIVDENFDWHAEQAKEMEENNAQVPLPIQVDV